MLKTPIARTRTSWKQPRRWCLRSSLSSVIYLQYFTNGLRGCCLSCLSWLVWECLIWDDEKANAISRPCFRFARARTEWLRQWQLPITSTYKEQTIRPRPVTTASPTSPDLCTCPTSEHLQVNRQWYCVMQWCGREVNQTATAHHLHSLDFFYISLQI